MELSEIKSRLSILQVLDHYGLKPDRNHRLLCPFHPDKTPSLQIYPATNTFCCFSSNCQAGTGDVVQFIQLKENCSKHEALVKASELAQGGHPLQPSPTRPAAADALVTEAIFTNVFSYYRVGLARTRKAVDYCTQRCLDYTKLELAYNSGGLHGMSKNHHLVKSMTETGLLKPHPHHGHSVWAKDCILFALKNADNKITSLYGRSILNDKDSRHFYLPNRTGLYPGYPKPATTKLILTESIIDAASLLQQSSITEVYAVLALYGTNGLTEEHQQAILSVKDLQEIILMLNADDAGRAATGNHYRTLKQLLPEIIITNVTLPDGEDVNSLLQSHDDPKILSDLIEARTSVFAETAADRDFSFRHGGQVQLKKENPQTFTEPASQPITKLNTSNPELLIYDNCELYFEILGGIKITGLDRMKVTLKVQHKEKVNHPQWYSIDLYNQVQREQTINNVAETLELSTQATTTTFINLIT